jgi:hypothetical protein
MTAREFPNWEALYQENPVEIMPRFNPDLDLDVKAAILDLNGSTALELATGCGTHAISFAERSFQIIAADLSATEHLLRSQNPSFAL